MVAIGPHLAPLARWLRLELEVWSFFLCGWWWTRRVPQGAVAFTHHEEAGWSAIAAALAMLLVVEGAVVHVWLSHAGAVVPMWIALGVHVYGLVWVVGDALALRARRTCCVPRSDATGARLELRVGVRARGRFPVSSILEVQTGSWSEAGPGARLVSVSGPANVEITFASATKFEPVLGAPVWIRVLLLRVDQPVRFAQTLAALRSSE